MRSMIQLHTLIPSLLLLGIVGLSFAPLSESPTRLKEIKVLYHSHLADFENSINELQSAARLMDTHIASQEFLQDRLLRCRLQMKKMEALTSRIDPQGMADFINGAPLPSLEENTNEVSVLEPEGLQILDELIFCEDPYSEKAAILQKAENLKNGFEELKGFWLNANITDRLVLESIRQDLIRVFTLGLTGFDTPGSGNAIPEARNSLEAQLEMLTHYKSSISPRLYEETQGLYQQAFLLLRKSPNFDHFDRLGFLTQFINPLYAKMYEIHRHLHIETEEEVVDWVLPLNYHATNIFSEDLFNPGFYSNLYRTATHDQKIELGRMLFFDPVLSKNMERSCASCHQPEKAFTDGKPKSIAFDFEGNVGRNAPTIIDATLSKRFFYDMRLGDLKKQMEHVVFNEQEFNSDFNLIVNRLMQSEAYVTRFQEAYPELKNRSVSKWSIEDAITAYVASLISFSSPFDQYVRGEITELDPSVKRGFNLFMGKATCGTCHFAPTFNGLVPPYYRESESEVLGVPATTDTLHPILDTDKGRRANGRVTEEVYFYENSFKTTTTRNVALTAPYMHNGVYTTLKEVIDFYNKGGGIGLGLDVPHQTLPPNPLELDKQEVADLVAFMEALTDTTGLTQKPDHLPLFENQEDWNERVIGGSY